MSKRIRIALAGNSNVGKSVIFNQLTGLQQHIGNWPGKTVERAEGSFHFKGYDIDVIDLPGIYSLSTYSIEERVTREYIVKERPDVVIDVIDASVLERNLFLTMQLTEMGVPMVIALNQVDMAGKKGIKIDHRKLEKALGIPVIPTVAVTGKGINKVVEAALRTSKQKKRSRSLRYGKEIEKRIGKLSGMLKGTDDYPPRWVAIKLLEGDSEIEDIVRKAKPSVLKEAGRLSKCIRSMHGHSCQTAVTCERYSLISRIAGRVMKKVEREGPGRSEKLHSIMTHRIWGYPFMIAVLLAVFFSIFTFGSVLSVAIEDMFVILLEDIEPLIEGNLLMGLAFGLLEGAISVLTVIIPYILPFYLILGFMENSGYLSRVAFLMDNVMHRIGLHGKAFIPIIMGFGCNVPACLGCRIMETHRERLIAIFVTTLIPCAAVTAVILGLVARFVSVWWALGLYVIDLAIVLILGRIAFRVLPGEPSGLIMEIHSLRMPNLKTMLLQTWFRIKDFIFIAIPIIIAGTVLIRIIDFYGQLGIIAEAMSPVTVWWLGLPALAGIAFIFGIVKKELTLVMLATLLGTTNFAAVLTPVQMLVFAFVTMLYIPCAATIAALVRETGWKRGLSITVFEILFATVMGGIFFRVLALFM